MECKNKLTGEKVIISIIRGEIRLYSNNEVKIITESEFINNWEVIRELS